jgi:hypothetical protein
VLCTPRALSFVEYVRRNTAAKYDFKSWMMTMQLCGAAGRFDEEKQLRKELEAKRAEITAAAL